MNRVYQLVRNRTTGVVQVASELARGAKKSGRTVRSVSDFLSHRELKLFSCGTLYLSLLIGASAWAGTGTSGGAGGTPQNSNLAGAGGVGSDSPNNDGGLGGCATCGSTVGSDGLGANSNGGSAGTTSSTLGGQGNTGGGAGGNGQYGGAGGGGGSLETSGLGGGGGGGMAGSSYSGGGGGGGGGLGIGFSTGGTTTDSNNYSGGNGGAGGLGAGGTLFVGHGYVGGGGGGGAALYISSWNLILEGSNYTGGNGGAAYYNPNDNSYGGGGGGGAGLLIGANNTTVLGGSAQVSGGSGGAGQHGGDGGAGIALGTGNTLTIGQGTTVAGGSGGTGVFSGTGGAGILMTGSDTVTVAGSAQAGGGANPGDAISLNGGSNTLNLQTTAHISGLVHSTTGLGDILNLTGGGNGTIGANQLMGFDQYNLTGGTWTLTGTGNATQNWNISGGTNGLIGTADSIQGNVATGNGSYVKFINNTGGTYGGVISGAGDVNIGGGTLNFSGANSYSGATVINGATLNLSGAGTLGNGTYVSLTGGTLDFSGSNLATNSNTQNLKDLVSDAGSVVHLGGARLNITGAGGGIFSGTLDGTGASLITLSGGQWGLSGSVTTGLPFQIGSNAQVNVYGDGTIARGVSIQSMGLLDISNANTGFSTAFLSGAGDVALGDKNLTLTNGSDSSFAGRIAGNGGLHLQNGTQIFTNQFGPVYSGNTVIDSGAKLVLAGSGSMPLSAHVINNGTLSIAGTASNTAKIASLAGDGSVTLDGSSSRALEITNASDTFAGVISNPIAGSPGNVIISGGTQTLSGVNTYSGTTTVINNATQATLALSGSGSIADSSQVNLSGGGALDISQTTQGATLQQVVSNLPGAGTVNLGNQTLTLSNPTAATFSYGGQIIGPTGGVHLQNGQMNLSYASTYAGDTTIDSGATVALTNQGTLSNSSIVANGTLDGSNTNLSNAAGNFVEVGGLAGSGTVKLGYNSLQINNAQNTVFNGQIEQTNNTGGANGLLVMNGGTQTFDSSVNLVSSLIVQQGATLKFGAQGSLSTPNGFTNMGTLDFSASTAQQLAGNMSGTGSLVLGTGGLKLTDANTGYGGVISGTGGLEFSQGQSFLGGANTYTGSTLIDSGASLLMLDAGNLANSEVLNAGTFDLSQLSASSTTIGGISGAGVLSLSSKNLYLTKAQGSFNGTLNGSGNLGIEGGQQIFNASRAQTTGFTGSTTIQGGLLEVGDAGHSTAFLPGDVTVQSGGTLRGHGTIGGNVVNQGTVFPGGSIGILSINGDYTQTSNGSLDIEIAPSPNPVAGVDYDQLRVQGLAKLDGALHVRVDSGNYTMGTNYSFLTANGGVQGTFASIDYNPLFANYITPVVNYSANAVGLTLTPTTSSTSSLGLAYTTAYAAVHQPWVTQNSLLTVTDELGSVSDRSVWLKALRGQGGADATSVDQGGVLVGGQIATSDHLASGLAFAGISTHTSDDAQQVDGRAYGLYGYGTYHKNGWRMDMAVGAGHLSQDSTRYLDPTELVARGSTHGWYGSASLKARYRINVTQTGFVEPYVGAAYLHTHTAAFKETGADLLNLYYEAHDTDLGRFSSGIKGGLNLTTDSGIQITPWVKLGAAAYAGDKITTQNLTLGALTEPVNARAAPSAALETGTGLSVQSQNGRLQTTLSYSGQYSHDSHFNAVHLKLQYHW